MRRVIVAALLAMLAGASAPALAQPKVDPEVQKHFSTGNDLYKEGKYDDALVEYDAAYDLSKNWKILYNRGQCLVMVRREPEAIASFQRYLDEGGDKVDADRRKQVQSDIAKLKDRLGTIVVTGAPDGAVVEIDGRPVTTLPAAQPITAGAGNHEVTVRPPGNGIPSIQQIKVVAGDKVSIVVSFGPTTTTTPTYVAAPVTSGGTLPPPMPQGMQPGGDVSPPPPPPPPARGPGGFIAPSFLLSLGLGGGITSSSSSNGTTTPSPGAVTNTGSTGGRGVGILDIGASWHPTPFWELGLFGGGGAGNYTLNTNVSNAAYAYSIFGLRLRIHPIRARHFDGWLGFDIGRYGESWTNGSFTVASGGTTDKLTGSALGLALAFGADFPITKSWAIGGAFRYLGASQVKCSTAEGASADCPASSADRGVSEFLLRLTFAIPYGSATDR